MSQQQWEYALLKESSSLETGDQAALVYLRPAKPESQEVALPSTTIAQLGTQGWELVTVTTAIMPDGDRNTTYYFKRPLDER
jgi:hypothetical protein